MTQFDCKLEMHFASARLSCPRQTQRQGKLDLDFFPSLAGGAPELWRRNCVYASDAGVEPEGCSGAIVARRPGFKVEERNDCHLHRARPRRNRLRDRGLDGLSLRLAG
jgi:hypothetical protein